MMLQQATAFRPFMRQFIALAAIAGHTGDHDIFWPIGAATRQWNHMINFVFLANRVAAIVAVTMLLLVLTFDIVCVVCAFSLAFSSAIVSCVSAVSNRVIFGPFAGSLWMALLPGVAVDTSFLRMFFSPFSRLSMSPFFIALMSIMIDLAIALSVRLLPPSGADTVTWPAISVQSITDFSVARKKFQRCQFESSTGGTIFEDIRQVQHSASLSLYHMMSSAGGVICRRSGATLADIHNFIA